MMSEEEIDVERIDRYLKNDLSTEELMIFHKRIESELGFAIKVEEYKNIINGISKSKQIEDFEAEIGTWEEEVSMDERDPRKKWTKYLAAAAVVGLLIVSGVYFFKGRDNKETPDQLFLSYFVPYEDVLTTRGTEQQASLERAFELYNKADYSGSTRQFELYAQDNPSDFNAMFYLALSELAEGKNLDHANIIFDEIIHQPESIFKEQAEWYRALAFLKQNKLSEAQRSLKVIVLQEGHDYQAKAKDLFDRLSLK